MIHLFVTDKNDLSGFKPITIKEERLSQNFDDVDFVLDLPRESPQKAPPASHKPAVPSARDKPALSTQPKANQCAMSAIQPVSQAKSNIQSMDDKTKLLIEQKRKMALEKLRLSKQQSGL